MKFYVKDQIVESDKALNIGEVFCKLGLDPSVIGGLVDGRLHDFYFYPSFTLRCYFHNLTDHIFSLNITLLILRLTYRDSATNRR